QLSFLTVDGGGDRELLRPGYAEADAVVVTPHGDAPVVPVAEPQLQGVELVGQPGFQAERAAGEVEPGVAPLDEVDGAGHRAEVDPLRGGAALDVRDVAVERLAEEPPRGAPV